MSMANNNYLKFVKSGEVSVDSGQILLIDPCYINESFPNGAASKDDGLTYRGVCRATLKSSGCGEVGGLGFATSSGYGDGVYPVYVARRGGRIASIRIDFITEDEEDFN